MKLISAIKVKTQSLKDERKNVRQLLDCIQGEASPDTFWLCQSICYYNKLGDIEKNQYFYCLSQKYKLLTEQIDSVGKTILFLRDNKWSF